jgi:hypothetical protein
MIYLTELSVAQNIERQMGRIMNSELESMWKGASRPRQAKIAGSAETLVPVQRASLCNIPVYLELFNKRC